MRHPRTSKRLLELISIFIEGRRNVHDLHPDLIRLTRRVLPDHLLHVVDNIVAWAVAAVAPAHLAPTADRQNDGVLRPLTGWIRIHERHFDDLVRGVDALTPPLLLDAAKFALASSCVLLCIGRKMLATYESERGQNSGLSSPASTYPKPGVCFSTHPSMAFINELERSTRPNPCTLFGAGPMKLSVSGFVALLSA